MNVKLRFCIGFLKSVLVLGGIFFFTLQGFAGVSNFYKWKDDQGIIHFTDDPLKIPKKYRSPDRVEQRRGLPSPSGPPVSPQSSSASGDSPAAPEQEGLIDPADDLKESGLISDEQAVMQEALSFLKSDIQRYTKYKDFVAEQRHAVLLRNDIVEVLPQKEGLEKKLESFDSALLKDIKSFLKKSLQKDYEAKNREHPRRLIFLKERSRIEEELPEKNILVEKLEAELASLPEKSPAPSGPARKGNEVKKPEPEKPEASQSGTKKY